MSTSAMGQSINTLYQSLNAPDSHNSPTERDQIEDYSIIATGDSVLKFDPIKSYAVCVGIDEQLEGNYSTLKSTGKDALSLGEAFVEDMGFQRDRVNIYTCSDTSFLCKKDALSTLFVNYARKVEDGGIFIFCFSGHGVNRNGEWALVPADFTGDSKTGITADELLNLIQIAECEASHVLIILDCCYAGGIGKKVESPENVMRVKPGVYVMCACAAKETSIAHTALDNSVFTFFLLHYFKKHHSKGVLEVKSVMTDVTELCRCFSSLMLRYTEEAGVKSLVMQPQFHTQAVGIINVTQPDGNDETDSSRFGLLFSLYDKTLPMPPLHQKTEQWLRSTPVQDALEMLNEKMPLSIPLQAGIICSMMHSIACLQLDNDRSHIVERNFIVAAMISVVSAIGYKVPDISISLSQLKLALKYYYNAIYTQKISAEPIEQLWLYLCSKEDKVDNGGDEVNTGRNKVDTGGDEVDTGEDEVDTGGKEVNALAAQPINQVIESMQSLSQHTKACLYIIV